jgi:hypothetical protein
MRSQEESKFHKPFKPSVPRPSFARRKPIRQMRRPGAGDADEQILRTKLAALVEEHRDLDGAIAVLFEAGTYDQLLITRLKKRKLQIKDEIARIEG